MGRGSEDDLRGRWLARFTGHHDAPRVELAPNGLVVRHCSRIPLARRVLLRLPPECTHGPLLVRVPILDRYLLRAAHGKHQPTVPLDPDALHPRNHQGALLPVPGLQANLAGRFGVLRGGAHHDLSPGHPGRRSLGGALARLRLDALHLGLLLLHRLFRCLARARLLDIWIKGFLRPPWDECWAPASAADDLDRQWCREARRLVRGELCGGVGAALHLRRKPLLAEPHLQGHLGRGLLPDATSSRLGLYGCDTGVGGSLIPARRSSVRIMQIISGLHSLDRAGTDGSDAHLHHRPPALHRRVCHQLDPDPLVHLLLLDDLRGF